MLPAARALGVVLLTGLATAGVERLVSSPLQRLAEAGARAVTRGDATALLLPLEEMVVLGAAVALTTCWLWGLLGVVSATVTVVAARSAAGRTGLLVCLASLVGDRLGPRCVRTLTAVALGVTALQGPARAEPSGEQAVPAASTDAVAGLSLPDRTVAVPSGSGVGARTPPASSTVRVSAGDSLWSIAARLLPPHAGPAEVDRAWRRLAAANSPVLGPDPDLIFPGTVLQVPPLDRPPGKEHP